MKSTPLVLILYALFFLTFVHSNIHRRQSHHPSHGHHHELAARQGSADMNTVSTRRKSIIVGNVRNGSQVLGWLTSLGPNGQWPASQIDYTSGCAAPKASWPAIVHWQRITAMSAAWSGSVSGAEALAQDPSLQAGISSAMDFWFSHDFKVPACIDSGGTSACPCGTPGFWNENWYNGIIAVPQNVGQSCLLLSSVLTPTQASNCTLFSSRTYAGFTQPINGLGTGLTGSNALFVASIGVDLALRTNNLSLAQDAYNRAHGQVVIEKAIMSDGIKADGSFAQHKGLLYNGGYGKDFTNNVLDLEIPAAGTQFAANSTSQAAFISLMQGALWMIYRDTTTGILHWDYSPLGRFIAIPMSFNTQTSSILLNATKIQVLGNGWSSSVLTDVGNSLASNNGGVNAGSLVGNVMFYASDYMVQRGATYVTTVKMFSTRTRNAECTNSQNPFGYHLSDGAMYTHVFGNEYNDVFSAWDWNRIPGTTATASSVLSCNKVNYVGLQSFVGGVSTGSIGIAAMKYTDPQTKTVLSWQKTWFFLDGDIQLVMIANVNVPNGADRAVFSVLDQRQRAANILVDNNSAVRNATYTNPWMLWHGNVGYSFRSLSTAFNLTVQVQNKTGDWSKIGTTGASPTTIQFVEAWLNHRTLSTPLAYLVYPSVDHTTFLNKYNQAWSDILIVANNATVSAVWNANTKTAMVVFWSAQGGSVIFSPSGMAQMSVATNANAAVIYQLNTGKVTVSDPSQTLGSVQITLTLGVKGNAPPFWTGRKMVKTVSLPSSETAGKSVVWTL